MIREPSSRIRRCSAIWLQTASRSGRELAKTLDRSIISRTRETSISPYSTAIAATWFASTSAAPVGGTIRSHSFAFARRAITSDSKRSSNPVARTVPR